MPNNREMVYYRKVRLQLATLAKPLVIGHHIFPDQTINQSSGTQVDNQVGEDQEPSFKQDGFISSLMVFFVLISVSFGIIIAGWMSDRQTKHLTGVDVDWCLFAYMLISILIMWIMSCDRCIDALTTDPPKESEDWIRLQKQLSENPFIIETSDEDDSEEEGDSVDAQDRFKKSIQSSLHLIGIGIFFILGMFLDILKIICHLSCADVYMNCKLTPEYVPKFLFHVTRLIFQATLLRFSFIFHHKTFTRRCINMYSLIFILAATVSLWFEAMVAESAAVFNLKDEVPMCKLKNDLLYTNHTAAECLERKTLLFKKYKEFSPYLFPLHIEFALMTCEILVHLYTSCSDKPSDIPESPSPDQTNDPNITPSIKDKALAKKGKSCKKYPPKQSEDSASQNGHTNDENILHGGTDDQTELIRRDLHDIDDNFRCMEIKKSTIGFILLNIIYITLGALTIIDNEYNGQKNTKENYTWRFVFEVCKLIYFAIMVTINYIGFIVTKRAKSKFEPFNGLEILLILMSIGYNTLCILEIIGVSFYLKGSHKENNLGIQLSVLDGMGETLLAARLVNFVQFFLQVNYTIHVSRLIFTDEQSKSITKSVIMSLVISNFFLWATDSFVEVNNEHVQPIATFYFGKNWTIVSKVFMPFYFFLRFNSFLMLLGAYFKVGI